MLSYLATASPAFFAECTCVVKVFWSRNRIIVNPKAWALPFTQVFCDQGLPEIKVSMPISNEMDLRRTRILCILNELLQTTDIELHAARLRLLG